MIIVFFSVCLLIYDLDKVNSLSVTLLLKSVVYIYSLQQYTTSMYYLDKETLRTQMHMYSILDVCTAYLKQIKKNENRQI